jgi:UDP-glucose 4-epimerase
MDCGLQRIIFSSSCATYGVPAALPIRESAPQRPTNPYGGTKLFIERLLHWYGQAYGLSWMALRYFNAAGADPEGEIGEVHDPETHLIPAAIEAALGRRPGDPLELVADPALAREVLGWQAEFRDLPSIVQTAGRWHTLGQLALPVE